MDANVRMCLEAKKCFVANLSGALSGFTGVGGIKNVRYEAWELEKYGDIQEWLIITFNGGAISVRNVNIDSHSAILREIGQMCDGGYYKEVEDYKKMTENKNWKQII